MEGPTASAESGNDRRVIGVDVGGTKIRAGVVDADGRVLRVEERRTPVSSQADLLRALEDSVDSLFESAGAVAAIGVGIPSRMDGQRALGAVNIPLGDIELGSLFGERFRRPVAVENDANVAALAEWKYGAGRGTRNLVMLTLGTGIGGGVVLEGRLLRGWLELGHVVIDHDGRPCQGTCTGRGHLEAVASGTAADSVARELLGPEADGATLVRAARGGDERATAALAEIGRYLGSGIGSFVNIFNPEVVVLGGGFAAAGELVLRSAREVVAREALHPAGERIRIVGTQLGGDAGLLGAALLGLDELGADG